MIAAVRQALVYEQGAIRELLEHAQLPTEDLQAEMWNHCLVLADEDVVIAAIGLEVFGEIALVRSLVVAAKQRGLGYGRRLVIAAENRARSLGVRTLFLLTNTAADFFAAMNYRLAERESAPIAIQQHAQFRLLCPSSAAFMTKHIEAGQ